MNFFILEDDAIQSEALQNIIRRNYPESRIAARSSAVESVKAIDNNEFDILILDVEVESENSIDYFEELVSKYPEISTKIIYLTAHKKYAMDALNRTHCFGYIEKPYEEKEIFDVVESCLEYNSKLGTAVSYFNFKVRGETHFVNREHIIYVEFESKKPILYTKYGQLSLPRTTVGSLINRLNDENCKDFIRCRRDSIVNLKHVSQVKKKDSLNYVILNNGVSLPIGDKYKDELFSRLRI